MSFFLEEKRTRERRRSIYYLQVRDEKSSDAVGRLVDISDEGLMIVTSKSMQRGAVHALNLSVDEADEPIHFRAETRWCRPDANPSLYMVGLHVLDPEAGYLALARLIKVHYSIESFRVDEESL